MCGGSNPVQNIVKSLDQANASFHPLQNVLPYDAGIDPILQGNMTVKGDVVPGSPLDKKNQNLGFTDAQQAAGFFSKAIAGGFGGAAAGGALAGGGETTGGSGLISGGSEDATLIGSGADSSMFGPGAADTLDQSLIGPNAGAAPGSDSAFAPPTTATGQNDPNQDPNAAQPGGGTSFIDATTPTALLDASTSAALGITPEPSFTGADAAFGNAVGVSPGGVDTGIFPGGAGGDYSIYTGESPTDMAQPLPDETLTPADVTPKGPGTLDSINAALRKVGLSPATAGLLGISGIQALSRPKTPQASRTLEGGATQGAAQANSVIQSGGQSSPAWTQQKAGIDAGIDQQIQQQTQAILQQAQNSGQGADSQVTIQQINKLKTQLETQRQNLYAQAQGQNVQAALQQLGISDQALSGVAAAQYRASQDARSSAANTAQMALMLQALSGRSGGGSASILPPAGNEGAPTG